MTDEEARALIAAAVPRARAARWADLGAGTGTFTRALAGLLGPGCEVHAVDRDARAAAAPAALRLEAAHIRAHRADFAAWSEVPFPLLDGILLANSLHFVAGQAPLLARLRDALRPGGRIVVVEYEGRAASRWVPYPVPFQRLAALVPPGMSAPVQTGSRPSAFGGTMYAAFLTKKS